MELRHLTTEIILEIADLLEVADVNSLVQTWACKNSRYDDSSYCYNAVKHAIAAGADVNITWAYESDSIFHRVEEFEKLKKFSWEGYRFTNITSLVLATLADDPRIARLLVEAGACIDMVPSEGIPPIIATSYFAKTKSLRFLLSQDVNLKVRLADTDGPLACAAESGDVKAVQMLLDSMDYPDKSEFSESSAIFSAVSCEKTSVLELLLASPKLDPNEADSLGTTPLEYCFFEDALGHADVLLKSHKININDLDDYGRTPFRFCIENQIYEGAILLIKTGRVWQRDWDWAFQEICSYLLGLDHRVGVMEEMIWRVDMTIERAKLWKDISIKQRRSDLVPIIEAKLAEWEFAPDSEPERTEE